MRNSKDLEFLDMQADVLLKERPNEINKLVDEIEKSVADSKKKGIAFSFDDLLFICSKTMNNKNTK